MNDRIYQALTAAGLSTSPLSVLDHASTYASAFFALYDSELLYHEGGRNSQVPLRDVTRIHSDREGVLRVETSERTAVTASLVGYDPGRVQAFFQQVRDVTARAKELPVLPLNQAKAQPAAAPGLPGSSVSAAGMPGLSAYTPVSTPPPGPGPAPASTAPAPVAAAPAAPTPTAVPAASPLPTGTPPAPATASSALSAAGGAAPDLEKPAVAATPAAPPPMPTPTQPIATPSTITQTVTASVPAGSVTAARREAPRPEPVVISSMPPVSDPPAFQERAGERNRQASKAPPKLAEPDTSADAGRPGTGVPEAHTQGPLVSSFAGADLGNPNRSNTDAGSPSQEAQGLGAELTRRADGVRRLAGTVGLLAVVLGLAAIALAYFQWQGTGSAAVSSAAVSSTAGSLSAIWTLLVGGVGTVALLAFAEALRLLAALARSAGTRSDRPA